MAGKPKSFMASEDNGSDLINLRREVGRICEGERKFSGHDPNERLPRLYICAAR